MSYRFSEDYLNTLLGRNESPASRKRRNGLKLSNIRELNKFKEKIFEQFGDSICSDIISNCLNSIAIIKNSDGQDLISYLIVQLGSKMIDKVFVCIDEMLPKSNNSVISGLSNILYSIWKNSNMNSTKEYTEELIQKKLCNGCIRLNPFMASKIRLLLSSFHENRYENDVNDLLVRLYDPILWRYLSVANWKVRLNSTALFAILFPLIDSSITSSGYQSDLNRQYCLLQQLLFDQHPEVRVAAIQGTCRVLRLYWEIIPVDKLQELLNILVTNCMRDKEFADVRIAVLDGLRVILGNPLSQYILQNYLPRLSSYIHDIDISVRYSMSLLVLQVSKIEGMDYKKIISPKQILARISKEYILFQVNQATHCIKRGGYVEFNSVEYISNNEISSEFSINEPLQVARILAELLNSSIFSNKSPHDQLKYCHFLCEQCPIGLIGYASSLSISINQNFGNDIPPSERLRLGVMLISTTIDSYLKGNAKMDHNKAKVLLSTGREILKPLLKGNDQEITKLASDFFFKTCSDAIFSKFHEDKHLWLHILQLLLDQDCFTSTQFPLVTKFIIQDLWHYSLNYPTKSMDLNTSQILYDGIIPLMSKWKLYTDMWPILYDGTIQLLKGKVNNKVQIPSSWLLCNEDRKRINFACLYIINNSLYFKEIRDSISNSDTLLNSVISLGEYIVKFYKNPIMQFIKSFDLLENLSSLLVFIFSILSKTHPNKINNWICLLSENMEPIPEMNTLLPEFLISYIKTYPSLLLCTTGDCNIINYVMKFISNLPSIFQIIFESKEYKSLVFECIKSINILSYAIKQLFSRSNSQVMYQNLIEKLYNSVIPAIGCFISEGDIDEEALHQLKDNIMRRFQLAN
ncbi:HEAT repeat family protein [Cryptosporidium serpentis]